MPHTVSSIVDLVRVASIDFEALEEAFGEANHKVRVEAIRQFDTSIQRRLYDQAAGRARSIEEIVPPEHPPMTEVIHEGHNTLPAFNAFQKRFCRPDLEDRDVLWGYNDQTLQLVTGPGYFVAYDDESTEEVCIDYRELPSDHPEGWPEIVSNESRLGRFVYAGTLDRLRRVSTHVSIGRAYQEEGDPMDAWFTLVRHPS